MCFSHKERERWRVWKCGIYGECEVKMIQNEILWNEINKQYYLKYVSRGKFCRHFFYREIVLRCTTWGEKWIYACNNAEAFNASRSLKKFPVFISRNVLLTPSFKILAIPSNCCIAFAHVFRRFPVNVSLLFPSDRNEKIMKKIFSKANSWIDIDGKVVKCSWHLVSHEKARKSKSTCVMSS